MFDGNVELPAGHILRVKPDGSKITLLAGGLRNPLDIAFNDAAICSPSTPTWSAMSARRGTCPRVCCTSFPAPISAGVAARGGFPAWYADTLPSVIDIGLSSPTGIYFGYGADFPQKYREALYILDWSYGRIIAVHLKERSNLHGGAGRFCVGTTVECHRRLHWQRWRDVVHHRRAWDAERIVSGNEPSA
jgi:hypothetical protein